MPTVRQRYGQTDGRLTIAIPRFALRALRASRGKKGLHVNTNANTNAKVPKKDVVGSDVKFVNFFGVKYFMKYFVKYF